MTVINRYNTTLKGSVIMVGNALGLYGPGGVANLTTSTPAPPSGGTTTVYTSLSNAVNLQVPTTGTVVRAELSWIGFYASAVPFNASIFLRSPKGVTSTIAVNPATYQFNSQNYTQSVDVTSIIQAGGNGFYTVSQVPCTLGGSGSGFILMVVYEDSTETFRNINIWSMFELPLLGVPMDVTISGFSTPSTGNVSGRLIVAVSAGNSEQGGDTVRFGPVASNLVTLSGPNNLASNFFASQINNNAGLLDTTGSWGNSNATPGSLPATGNRVWYDVTRIDASSGLTNNQTSGIVRLLTSQDYILAHAMALQVDVNSANLTPITKSSNNYFANIGDTITYTVTFGNSGLVSANNVTLVDTIPNGLSFIPGTVNVNGTSQGSFNPNPPGFNIGDVGPNARVTISFKALVITIPTPNPTVNQATVNYSFISAPGLNPITASDDTNFVYTQINHVDLGATKIVSKAFANVGDILTYTIVIKGSGNTTANNVILSDTIPSGTSFVANSMTQNGAALGGNPNPPGVTLNNISKTGVTTLSFKVKVDTIPNPNPIQNTATVTYTYLVDPTLARNDSGSTNTNIVNTQVNNANLGNITKSTDKNYATCGETINYTIAIPNTGNVTAQNVIFKDTIPNGTTFVTNSVFINGTNQPGANPTLGFAVPNIAPGATSTIVFSVVVQC